MFRLALRGIGLGALALLLLLAAPPAGGGAQGYVAVDLGTVPGFTGSWATAMNDDGMVIGQLTGPGGPPFHAFAWTRAGGMVDIGTLGGATTHARAIDSHGRVVGLSSTASGAGHAFSWTRAGGMVDLGAGPYESSAAVALNDAGQVVGIAWNGPTSIDAHGVSWTADGRMVPIESATYPNTSPTAVNAHGLVVGDMQDAAGASQIRPFAWTASGGVVDLGTLGGTSRTFLQGADGVNDAGQVVGSAVVPAGDLHAFSWTREGGMTDLGTLGGPWSQAFAVNASGQVVGAASTASDFLSHAFVWTRESGMRDLGAPGPAWSGVARAINDAGLVVGQGGPLAGPSHAFAWAPSTGVVDLGTADGATSSTAIAVDESGRVAGTSTFGDGVMHATLWTADTTPPVLTVPADLTVDATSPAGAAVTYAVSAADDLDPSPAVTCSPPSGSTFGLGATTVACTATDAAGNDATASFTVFVRNAAEQLRGLQALIASYELEHGYGARLSQYPNVAARYVEHGQVEHARQELTQFLAAVDRGAGKVPPRLSAEQAAALSRAALRILAVLAR
jgi:probable HAF family extracellular repeat protein